MFVKSGVYGREEEGLQGVYLFKEKWYSGWLKSKEKGWVVLRKMGL